MDARCGIAWGDGDALFLIGGHGEHLGQSLWLDVCRGRRAGPPPPVDLATESRHAAFVRAAIRDGLVTACHDLSSGGLAVALTDMACASGIGARLAIPDPVHVMLFSEDEGRYIVSTATPDALLSAAVKAEAGIAPLGHAGGTELTVPGRFSVDLFELDKAYRAFLPAFAARYA